VRQCSHSEAQEGHGKGDVVKYLRSNMSNERSDEEQRQTGGSGQPGESPTEQPKDEPCDAGALKTGKVGDPSRTEADLACVPHREARLGRFGCYLEGVGQDAADGREEKPPSTTAINRSTDPGRSLAAGPPALLPTQQAWP